MREPTATDPRVGLVVTHRRYVSHRDAHYGGSLLDGAYVLGLFGDVATEVCLRTDSDEGLLASYTEVTFSEPVRAGDVVEVTATVVAVGNRSRTLELLARVCARARPDVSASAGEVIEPPRVVTTARAVVVIP
jgi:3-aminobutyryl-CoA ammonia-lyase